MPWNDIIALSRWPGTFAGYDQWVAQARQAEHANKGRFIVGLREQQVTAWNLPSRCTNLHELTQLAQREPETEAECYGGYERFIVSIARTPHRTKVFPVWQALARERSLNLPLTSRRILEVASFLAEDTPIPPFTETPAGGASAMETTSCNDPPGTSDGRSRAACPVNPESGHTSSPAEIESEWAEDSGTDSERGDDCVSDFDDDDGPAPGTGGDNDATVPGGSRAGTLNATGTLLPPETRPRHQRFWTQFVQWCDSSQVQSWPASSETVADYLRDRAKACAFGTLSAARTAISQTHRQARLIDPCTSDLVTATLKELYPIDAKSSRHYRSIKYHIDPTSLEAIRKSALDPRIASCRVETDHAARQRGLLDIALCSLVAEHNLSNIQLEALRWQDLQAGTDGNHTITVRPDSGQAARHLPISPRLLGDLEAIRASAGLEDAIFPYAASNLGRRLRNCVVSAGIASRPRRPEFSVGMLRRAESPAAGPSTSVAETLPETGSGPGRRQGTATPEWPRAAGPGEFAPPALHPETQLCYDKRWKAFADWCAARGEQPAPTSDETVVAYLRHLRAQKHGRGTLKQARSAIARVHREAGFDNPCSTSLVQMTIRDMFGKQRAPTGLHHLDAATLAAIRDTAIIPRPRGRGHENPVRARQRGLLDIALCSLVHATRLTLGRVAQLKWGDLQPQDGGEAQFILTRSLPGGQPVTEQIAVPKQVMLDLEAIRPTTEPQEMVFGTCSETLRSRFSAALLFANPGGPSGVAPPGTEESAPPGPS